MKEKRGITLVSLVITIILLLILATVAITAAIDGNGLFTKANQAKEEMRYDQIKEAKDLWEINTEADRYTEEKTAGSASDVINKLYEQGTITEEERDKLLDGQTIIVANKEIAFIQENGLYLTLSKEYKENNKYAIIYAMPQIGGIPEYITYEEYIKPEEVLATKDDAGKAEIIVEYEKTRYASYYENNYPGQEVTIELVLQDYGVESMEEMAAQWNYNTVEEMIIGEWMIGYAEYNEYNNDYRTNYRKYITITKPDGSTTSVTNMSNGLAYAALENGTYTFTANYEGQNVTKAIEVTGIKTSGEMELAKEDEFTYLIYSIEDLIKFSKNVNNGNYYEGKTIKLMRNLDFNEDSSYVNPTDTATFGDYNEDGTTEGIKAEVTKQAQRGFIPIGLGSLWIPETYQTIEYYFKGTFEGNNYEIANLHMNISETEGDIGLFGKVKNGNMKNLTLTGRITITDNTGVSVGALVGSANYVNIENCTNKITINTNTTGSTGGFVGYMSYGEVKNCTNIGSIINTGNGWRRIRRNCRCDKRRNDN